MKILLIGASGMIGSRVLDEAVARGHEVTAAARRPEKVKTGPKIKAVALDGRLGAGGRSKGGRQFASGGLAGQLLLKL